MDSIDFVFNDNQYQQLRNEYQKTLTPTTKTHITLLNNIIETLKCNNFQMPLSLQNQILSNLSNAKQILEILNTTSTPTIPINPNNPFALIAHLSQLSKQLNSYTLKSAYQIISLKSNDLILKSINEISNYFANKNLKIFKFI